MELQRWNIYWNEYVSDTYLYGSEITFHKKDDVEFLNHLMSERGFPMRLTPVAHFYPNWKCTLESHQT